ncbi:MAG: ECF-type sigma factor [Steroidobacteraceae bacterium]
MPGTEADRPDGQNGASARALATLYRELRRIAAAQMSRTAPGSTLQPTALVHEAWLRLSGSCPARWRNEAHFVAAAARTMRHILIDRARRRGARRHGGGRWHINIDQVELSSLVADDAGLLVLDAALRRFASCHPEAAALLELHCFAGLEVADAAGALGLSRATAYRRWQFAEAWLRKELGSNL